MSLFFCLFISVTIPITDGESRYRLPVTIKPTHYDFELQFHFNSSIDSSQMDGMSHVLLDIYDPHTHITDASNMLFEIQLHMGPSVNIIDSSLYFPILNETLDLLQVHRDESTQIASFYYDAYSVEDILIDFPSQWVSAEVYFLFSTKLINNFNAGMYITSYEYNGTLIQNAVSSFGLTDARLAFPCFDEPSFKSTFDFTITAPLNITILSNAAVLEQQPLHSEICSYQYTWGVSTKCKTVTFETTPLIAPYVLTIFAGEYKSVSDIDSNNIVQSVWSPVNEYEYGQFALDIGIQTLPYFQELFEIDYGLSKMDNIAVSSFPWGAMESYGAVVYNKGYVLADLETDDRSHLAYVAQLVPHEYAHMWFGDLVTCHWWDDTWLNEGFAQFYGYDVGHIIHPELHVLSDWIEDKKSVMLGDMSIYTETVIGQNIESVSDILGMFGDLQYTKAGAILQMMQSVMGNETFDAAIVDYIDTYAHNTSQSQDLIDIFNHNFENSGDMIRSYISQPGIPIIYVDTNEFEDNNIQFRITQKRFVKEGPNFYSEPYFDPEMNSQQFGEQNWWIHLTVINANNDTINEGFINNESVVLNVERVMGTEEYYLFNAAFKNYASVRYDTESFAMILDSWHSLSYWNQMNVMFDRYNQMISNYVFATSYLELIQKSVSVYYTNENEIYDQYLTNLKWNAIIESLTEIDEKICFCNDPVLLKNYRNFSRQILKPLYHQLNGYNLNNQYNGTNSENIINLRNEVIVALIRFKDEETINIGYDIIKNMSEIKLDNNGRIEGIDSNVLRSVFISAMAKLDTDIFYKIVALYSHPNAGSIRKYIRESFSVLSDDTELVQKSYDLIMRGSDGYNSDIEIDLGIPWYKINALHYLSKCNGIEYVWQQLIMDRDNETESDFEFLLNTGYYSSGLETLTSLPNTFSTKNKFDEMYEFYLGDYSDAHIIDSTEQTANMALEDIAANINWVGYNKETLKEYLESNNESMVISSTQEAETTEMTATHMDTTEINPKTSETMLVTETETTDVETTEETAKANDGSDHFLSPFIFIILLVGFVIFD